MKRHHLEWFVLVAGVLFSHIAEAAAPTVTREVLIPADNKGPIRPWAITSTADHNVIVAGSMGYDGWIAKVALDGKVLWSYDMPLAHVRPFQISGNEIKGVVEMPGGSTFACGNAVRTPGAKSAQNAFVVKLDAAGKRLVETDIPAPSLPATPVEPQWSRGTFSKCIGWMGGVAIVGQWSRVFPAAVPGKFPASDSFYWVVALDAEGRVRWNKVLPMTYPSVTPYWSVIGRGNELLLIGYMAGTSDAFRLGSSGEVIAQKVLQGNFNVVDPLTPSGSQLFGLVDTHAAFVSGNTNASLLTVNDQLEEVGRSSSTLKGFLGSPYALPDGSITVIGRASDGTYLAGVVHIDSALKDPHHLELPRTRGPIFSNGGEVISAAGDSPGVFLVARTLLEQASPHPKLGTPLVFNGAVIDVLQVNQ